MEKEEVKEEVKPETIEVMVKLHAKMKEENDRAEELLEKQISSKAEAILSGQSDAGEEPEPIDKEQEVKDRCNKQLEGLGMSI